MVDKTAENVCKPKITPEAKASAKPLHIDFVLGGTVRRAVHMEQPCTDKINDSITICMDEVHTSLAPMGPTSSWLDMDLRSFFSTPRL